MPVIFTTQMLCILLGARKMLLFQFILLGGGVQNIDFSVFINLYIAQIQYFFVHICTKKPLINGIPLIFI